MDPAQEWLKKLDEAGGDASSTQDWANAKTDQIRDRQQGQQPKPRR